MGLWMSGGTISYLAVGRDSPDQNVNMNGEWRLAAPRFFA